MANNRASVFVESESVLDLSKTSGANEAQEDGLNSTPSQTSEGAGSATSTETAGEKAERTSFEIQVEKQVQDVLSSEVAINTMLNRLKHSITATKEFSTFLKKRSLLEDDYAQGIKKLCKLTSESMRRPDHKQGTFAKAYEDTIAIQDQMADNGMLFAQTLYRMAEELMELATSTERSRKMWKQTGLSAEQRVADLENAMLKSQQKYKHLAEEYERAKTGDIRQPNKMFGFKAPKSAAQQEEDLLKKAQAADADYKSRVQTLQTEMGDLIIKGRPEAVNALQDLIRETDSGIAMQMQKFVTYNEKLLLSNGLCVSPLRPDSDSDGHRSLRDVVASINNEKDLNDYIRSHHSRLPPTHPIPTYERHPALGPAPGGMTFHATPNHSTTSFQAMSPPNVNNRPSSNSNGGPLNSNAVQPQTLPKPSSSNPGGGSHSRNFSMASILGLEPKSSSSDPPNSSGGPQPQQSQIQPQIGNSSSMSRSGSQVPQSPPSVQPSGSLDSPGSSTVGQTPSSARNRLSMLPSFGSSSNHNRYASVTTAAPPQLGALSFQSQPTKLGQFNSPTLPTAPQIPLPSQLDSFSAPTSPPTDSRAPAQSSPPTDNNNNKQFSAYSPAASGPDSSSLPPAASEPQYNNMGGSMLPPAYPPLPGTDYSNSRRIFGMSLADLYERDCLAVPMIVIQCIQAVDLYGLSVEGIYRQSGSKAHISQLKEMFDTDSTQPALDFRVPENFFHDVNSVTGLLKQFLRELPDSIFTKANYQSVIEAAQITDDTVRRDTLHAIINELPDPNYATLRSLTLHLHRVVEQSHVTRMTSSNLAMIFGPTLLGGDPATSVNDHAYQVKAVDTVLQNAYQIFDDD